MNSFAVERAYREIAAFSDGIDRLGGREQMIKASDCNLLLRVAIDVFRWVAHADECLRRDFYEGRGVDDDVLFSEAIGHLYCSWLVVADRMGGAILRHKLSPLSNERQFQSCYASAKRWAETMMGNETGITPHTDH